MGLEADKTEHAERPSGGGPPAGDRGGTFRDFGSGLAGLLAGIGYEMATALFPIFFAALGGSAALLGGIEGISGAVSRVVPLGIEKERRPLLGKPILLVGCLLSLLMGTLAWVTGSLQASFVRILARIGQGVREEASDPFSAGPEVPLRSGFPRAMNALGAVLGPLAAMALVGFLPFRQIFWASLIPGFSAVAAVIFLVRRGPERSSPKGERFRDAPPLPLSFRPFLTAVGMFGLGNFAPTLLILRANELLTRDHGPARAASLAVFLYFLRHLFYAGFSYPLRSLANRFGKRRLLGIGYFLFALTVAGFIFVPPVKSYVGWFPALLFLVLLFSLAGIDAALVDSAERALAVDLLTGSPGGGGEPLLRSVNGVGCFVSSLAVGLLWTLFSPTVGFLFAAVMGFLGGALLYRVPAR